LHERTNRYVTEKLDIEASPAPGAMTVSALDPQDDGKLSAKIPSKLSADRSLDVSDIRDGVYYLILEQSHASGGRHNPQWIDIRRVLVRVLGARERQ
jgi:hypothetical protein